MTTETTDRYAWLRAHGRSRAATSHPTIAALDRKLRRIESALPDCCDCPERTYLVAAAGRVKIGTSRNVVRRVIELQMASPVDLRVLVVSYGNLDFEAILHRMCADHRLYGEWFTQAGVERVLGPAISARSEFDECLRCAVNPNPERRELRAAIKRQAKGYRPRFNPKRRFPVRPDEITPPPSVP